MIFSKMSITYFKFDGNFHWIIWLQTDVRFEPNNGHELTSNYCQLKIWIIISTFYLQLQLRFDNTFPNNG